MSNNSEFERILKFINSVEWTFSKTMPQWPHEWIIKHKVNRDEFKHLVDVINNHPTSYEDTWNGRWTAKYFVVDNYKYWVLDDIINRATPPLRNTEVIANGKIYMATHPKPKGRLYGWIDGLTMEKIEKRQLTLDDLFK